MEKSKYKPSELISFEQQNDTTYILGVFPKKNDEDYFYEIHIKTDSPTITNIKESLGEYIFVDLISSNRLEIYTGEHIEDCCSDGEFEYISYDFRKQEKANKALWKPKFNTLRKEYQKVFERKLKPYEETRRKVVNNYREIYNEELEKCNKTDADFFRSNSFFDILYQLFEHNPPWDSFKKLINPNFRYYAPAKKDWKEEYVDLEQLFVNLKELDVEDYSIIKTHIINSYKNTFNHMLPNFKHNYKTIDESRYKHFFYRILEKLQKTED